MRCGDKRINLDEFLPLTAPVLLTKPLLTNFNGTLIEKVPGGNYENNTKLGTLKDALLSNNSSLSVTQTSSLSLAEV